MIRAALAFAFAMLFTACNKDATSSQVDAATLPVSDSSAVEATPDASPYDSSTADWHNARAERCSFTPAIPEGSFGEGPSGPIVTVFSSEYPRLVPPIQLHACQTFSMARYKPFPGMTALETAQELLSGYIREQFKARLYENIGDSTNGIAALQWQLKISGSTARGWVQIEPLANGDFYVQGIDNETITPYYGIYTLEK